MPQQPLDYRSPLADGRRASRTTIATVIVACVVLAANGLLLAAAAADRSWGALGIAMMIGPITNGILLLLSIACIPLVKSAAGGSIGPYVAAAIALPLAAVPLDFVIIASMSLHGC